MKAQTSLLLCESSQSSMNSGLLTSVKHLGHASLGISIITYYTKLKLIALLRPEEAKRQRFLQSDSSCAAAELVNINHCRPSSLTHIYFQKEFLLYTLHFTYIYHQIVTSFIFLYIRNQDKRIYVYWQDNACNYMNMNKETGSDNLNPHVHLHCTCLEMLGMWQ
jgi:hypothetical protein